MKGNGQMAKAGKAVGIKFDTERYIVNSIKSHLLLQHVLEAYGKEKQMEMMNLLCQQYFEEAVNLNSDKVLSGLCEEVHINKEVAMEYFTSPINTKKLINEMQKQKKRGILNVPYHVIYIAGYNDKRPVSFSGSQNKIGFIDTFHKLMKEYHKANKKQNGK